VPVADQDPHLTNEGSGADHTSAQAELLAKADLFAGLERVALAKLAANLDRVVHADGEAACVQGDVGDSLFLVSEGRFDVFVHGQDGIRDDRVASLGRGACFGEMALLTGEPRSATVRAVGPGDLLRLDRDCFVDLLRSDPKIGLALSATLSRRVRHASRSLTEAREALADVVESHLARLSPDSRRRLLQASLLVPGRAPSLDIVFGAEAERIRAQLADVGWQDGPPPALMPFLDELHEREAGRHDVLAFADNASLRLANAGHWTEALALAHRVDHRATFVALLSQALRDGSALTAEDARSWIESVSDDEAAGDAALALARAQWHESQGDAATAADLLRRTRDAGRFAGAANRSEQFVVEIARLAAAAGAQIEDRSPAALRARALWQHWRSRPTVALGAGVAATALGAAALINPLSPFAAFLLVLGAAVALWVAAVLPDFVVCFALVIVWVLLGMASPAEAVAGYGTSSWISVLAILSIASAISNSGLLFRFGLLLVRRLPRGLFSQGLILLVSGVVLAPLMPSSTARARLTAPAALTAAQTQHFVECGPESAFLGMATFIGSAPLLFLFLNGSTSCLLGLGLMPEESRARFDLLNWFLAAAPLAAVVAAGSLLVIWVVLRPAAVQAASPAQLDLQLSLLGKPSGREVAMGLILVATIFGWNVGPALGISSAIVGLASVLLAALAGCFNRQALQTLNWDFLLSYGVILTLPRVAQALGVNDAIAGALQALIGEGGLSPLVFVLSLAVLNTLVRFVLADDLSLLLLGLALVPTAPVIGVHPWIIIITLLTSFSPWFFPSQSVAYAVAYEAGEGRLFSHQQARRVCLGYTAVTLVGLAISVPYWHLLGLV